MSPENTMTTQEVNEYMEAVLSGKIKLEGLEGTVVKRLGEMNAEVTKLDQFISQASAQLEQARARMLNLNGRREGYAQLLIDEEVARRKEPKASALPSRARVTALSAEERETIGDILSQVPVKAEVSKPGR